LIFAAASDQLIDCPSEIADSPPDVTSSAVTSALLNRQQPPSPEQQVPPSAEGGSTNPADDVAPTADADGAIATAAAAPAQCPAVEVCAGCRRPITERYLLRAVDRNWHEDCLRCSCCDCRLGEVGSTLFTRSNLLLCRRDYLR
jgi:LIM domain